MNKDSGHETSLIDRIKEMYSEYEEKRQRQEAEREANNLPDHENHYKDAQSYNNAMSGEFNAQAELGRVNGVEGENTGKGEGTGNGTGEGPGSGSGGGNSVGLEEDSGIDGGMDM